MENKIDILKKEFPECFDREGNFNIEKFQEIVSPEAKLFKDSYGLNWLGKSYARALAQVESTTMIREDVEHNKQEENKESENIYIKGDNLEVLRHLNNGYREKIKMIYIDPPYNTKSGEFVYNDNRDFSNKELEKLVEAMIIEEDEKERILKWEGTSSSHSAWLTFMFPRLYLARKLLTDDGVIFISIDDNEASQLKLMCDDIFGEENFISQLIWEKKTGASDAKTIATVTEYVLIYTKQLNLSTKTFNKNKESYDLNRYKHKDEFYEERGPFYYDNLDRGGLRYSDSLNFEIEGENGKRTYPNGRNNFINDGWTWKWGKEKVEWGKNNGYIEVKSSKNKNSGVSVYYKNYLKVDNTNKPLERSAPIKNLITGIKNFDSSNEMKKIFKTRVFPYTKPSEYIITLLKMISNKNDIILDFFSGSATTAHAVNKLNLEDISTSSMQGGNRKWIMVQLEEEITPKQEAYKFCEENNLPQNITSIGIERIKIANVQMLDELEAKNGEEFNREDLEKKLGFKIFSIDKKIKELEEMKEFTPEIKIHEPISFIHNDKLDLVHTYKLQDGNFLNEEIEKIKFSWEKHIVGGDGTGIYIYEAYRVGEILYLIDSISSNEVLKGIIEKIDNDPEFKVNKIVLYGFTNTNGKYRADLLENIHNYNNKKGADIEVEVRY